jgi:hypothetical protein
MTVFRPTEKRPTGPTQLLFYDAIINKLRYDPGRNYLTIREILQLEEIKNLNLSETTKKVYLYKMRRKGYLQ